MDSSKNKTNSPFKSTTADRRRRVFEAAINEFAAKGFNAANINTIAKSAGISIGSMYSYFESKEDLFLAVMDHCLEMMYKLLSGVDTTKGVVNAFEEMLRFARESATENPQMHQIYLDCSSQSLRNLSERISDHAEAVTVRLYREILSYDKAIGRVRKDLDVNATAFMLDNLVMMYQFSFASGYYAERKKLFIGSRELGDSDELIESMTDFVRRAVEPQQPQP